VLNETTKDIFTRMEWGNYLARGISGILVFPWCEIVNVSALKFSEYLLQHGFAVVLVDDEKMCEEWSEQWNHVASEAFGIDDIGKNYLMKENSENGRCIIYRKEGSREFFDIRLISTESVNPMFSMKFFQIFSSMRSQFKKISEIVLRSISELLFLPENYFSDLTDTFASIPTSSPSSSVLRLSKYETFSDLDCERLLFGSHTDTTFITISPVAAVPG